MCEYKGKIVKCSELLEAEVKLVKTIDKKEERRVLDFIKTHLRYAAARSIEDRYLSAEQPAGFET